MFEEKCKQKKYASMHLDSELSSTKLTRNISAVIFFPLTLILLACDPQPFLCCHCAQCQVEVVAEGYN